MQNQTDRSWTHQQAYAGGAAGCLQEAAKSSLSVVTVLGTVSSGGASVTWTWVCGVAKETTWAKTQVALATGLTTAMEGHRTGRTLWAWSTHSQDRYSERHLHRTLPARLLNFTLHLSFYVLLFRSELQKLKQKSGGQTSQWRTRGTLQAVTWK